ncbi:cerebellin-2-like [Chaetodon auriga]|uniref:cerebellin-2-like n=1 Tax=Chaetodon auriga TaxID=39042 RepID=UPI00403307E4
MNFSILLVLSLFCGLIMAKDDYGNLEEEKNNETQSCYPDMCDVLKEVGVLREKLGVVENRLKDSEIQIRELKNKEETTVVFSAATGGGNTPIGPFSKDTTVIYRTVITNIGNAYSQVTGIFTAPVAGIYYFTLFHHAGGHHAASLSLMKNNQVVVMTYDHRTLNDGADNGGNAVFLQLQQGDQVRVSLEANTHVWGNDLVTTFSGFLLQSFSTLT